jgi:carboxypeptidase Taq
MNNLDQLKKHSREITNLGNISGLLGWDQEVMMPDKGIQARKQQKKILSGILHDKITSEELGELLETIDPEGLSIEDKAIYREIKWSHDRSKKVSRDLDQKISEKSSETVKVWQEAKEEDSFEKVRPHLEELLELKREYARQIDPDREPYQVLFDDYEPYISFKEIESALNKLKDELPTIFENAEKRNEKFEVDLDEETEKELCRSLSEAFGFDFDRGRLDLSSHPFTTGTQFDTRITTRFSDGLIESLLITAHETGHGLYQQGLPQEHYGTALGSSRELSIHESQSRLWENQVGRSKEFWEFFTSKLREKGIEASSEQLFSIANQVNEENVTRVKADEISYQLHIVIRFELGRKLVNGELEIEDLPEAWNSKMEDYLGISSESDADGCMQDIQWFLGNFGYFPTYSIGSILSAQIYSQAENEIENLEDKIEKGQFAELREWLKENIHSKGRLKRSDEMVEELVGGLDADEFIEYLREKYE